jgi:hypothetical protein
VIHRFPVHPFQARGHATLRSFDVFDLAALGCAAPPPRMIEVMDASAMAACHAAAASIQHRAGTMAADLASAAEAVNRCACGAWRPQSHAGLYQWAAVAAAWGADVLADHLTPRLGHEGLNGPAAKAINRLGELRDVILAGRTWWPAYRRAVKALAAVPVVLVMSAAAEGVAA